MWAFNCVCMVIGLSCIATRPYLFEPCHCGVRFFGVSRAVCRYFERYTSHRMAFQGLYGLRVWFYAHLEPLAPAILKRFGAGGYARPHYGGI